MKVVKQSFEILPERSDAVQQIGERARICYQSEPATDEVKFVQGLIKAKHNSTLEMADICIWVKPQMLEAFDGLASIWASPYMHTYCEDDGGIYISGSVRAWREFTNIRNDLTSIMRFYVASKYKKLFFDILDVLPQDYYDMCMQKASDLGCTVINPCDLHPHAMFCLRRVAVKFITNRAVSHELVRHRPLAVLQESQRYCNYSKDKFGNDVTFIDPSTSFPQYDESTGAKTKWALACKVAEDAYLQLLADGCSPQAARVVLPNSCKTELIMYATMEEWSHIFKLRDSDKADPSMHELMSKVHKAFINMFPGMFETTYRKIG